MIIKAPTALYETVIPTSPDVPGNVTYTISSQNPPRTERVTSMLPPAIQYKRLPTLTPDAERRRAVLGELKFTISKANPHTTGSNTKQFEIGQVLPFEESVDSAALDPMLVSPQTTIQHDTNLLDYEKLGMSIADVTAVTTAASAQFDALTLQLNDLKAERADLEIQIVENKKLQSETIKAISAVGEIVSLDPSLTVVATNLAKKLVELRVEEETLVTSANEAAAAAAVLVGKLRSLAQVIR